MANISKIQVDGVTYDIEDTVARNRAAGLSSDVKQALLACFEKVAWIDTNGQDYYDALEAALYPPANLESISAVYTQSGTVYTTDTLDSLKSDLVVTAHYTDATSEAITNYTLSGTLAAGTSTVTVTYGGKTTTFTVTVTERGALYPLATGEYTTGEDNPYYRFTVTNGNHVKFTPLRSVYSQGFANLHDGTAAAGNSSASVVNNLTTLFTFPANTEITFAISNVVNADNISFNCNFRKANTNTSSSFGIENGTHLDGATVTKTLSADEDIGCVFFYKPEGNVTAGTTLEFDMSLTVGGAKYI